MTGLMPPNPLSYEGQVVVPYINRPFPPTTAFINFNVPTIWTDTEHQNVYILVAKAQGVATWLMFGASSGEIDTITTPDSTVVMPTSGNVNFLNGTGFNITGSGSDITFSADPITITAGTGLSGGGSVNLGGSTTLNLSVPVSVPDGGTGVASTTAYGVVCGGMTTTGAFQNAGAGTSGKVLTSNGATMLPSFQAIPYPPAFISVNQQVFTMSGTYTPTSQMKYCMIEVLGGGGGGGGAATTTTVQTSAASGGGAGGYARKVVSSVIIGTSQSVTIGVAGAAGVAGNNNGGDGGTTSVGAIISATGGSGGLGADVNNLSAAGSAGGSGSSGDFNVTGSYGGSSLAVFASGYVAGMAGFGGSSIYGGGGAGGSYQQTGQDGGGYGAGGGGGVTSQSTQQAGGAGTAGIVIITEYIS